MPITTVDLRQPPGFLVQVCAGCGLEHTIELDRGAAETKKAPFAISDGATLELSVDGKPYSVAFSKGDAADLAATTAVELVAKLAAIAGANTTAASSGTVVIASKTTGASSRVEITGGTARKGCGFSPDLADPCPGRPILGVKAKNDHVDLICLRRCGCGTQEIISRAWDVAPAALAGSAFYEHRKAVNSIAEHFKSQGWVHPDLATDLAAEKTRPPDRFADGTKLLVVPPFAKW